MEEKTKKKKRERRKRCRRKNVPLTTCPAVCVPRLPMPSWLSIVYDRRGSRFPSNTHFPLMGVSAEALAQHLLSTALVDALAHHPSHTALIASTQAMLENRRRIHLPSLMNRVIPQPRLDVPAATLIRCGVTFPQYRAFLRLSLSQLFPVALLGARNLQLSIDSIAFNLFHLRRRECVHWRRLFSPRLRVSDCPWLRGIPHSDLQLVLLRRIIHWLLQFATALTRCHFYVTEGQSSCNELLFYRKCVWSRLVHFGFDQFTRRCQLQPLANAIITSEEKKRIGQLRFLPKREDLRAIVKCTDKDMKQRLLLVKTVFNFLMRQREQANLHRAYGLYNFEARLRRFARVNQGKRFFLVKTDVNSCFDIVDHHILRALLDSFIDARREFVVCQTWITQRSTTTYTKRGRRLRSAAGYSRDSAWGNLRLKDDRHKTTAKYTVDESHFTGTERRERLQTMSGGEIRELCKHLLNEKIAFAGRVWSQTRGVRQGSSLSCHFNELYLHAMEREIFQPLLQSPAECLLLRHIDDYLLVTTREEFAQDFARTLLAGVDKYHVYVNPEKTVANITVLDSTSQRCLLRAVGPHKRIAWCGYGIEQGNLQLSIDASRYRGSSTGFPIPETKRGEKRAFIMRVLHRGLYWRLKAMRRCEKRSTSWMRPLTRFAYSYYARPISRRLHVDKSRYTNRQFLRYLGGWLAHRFSTRKSNRLRHLFGTV